MATRHPTAVAWIRGHIGLHGNTQADQLATFHSHLGVASLLPRIATHEDIRQRSKEERRGQRTQPGFGMRCTDWGRHALSAYTWLRTDKGSQMSCLFDSGHQEGNTYGGSARGKR